MDSEKTFISYSREDSAFVLQLAKDLEAAGAKVWLDQLHIKGGERWPVAIEKALEESPQMLIILSPASVASNNVMDEVSYALECGKKVIPVLWKSCQVSFRLRNLQRVDFTNDYTVGLKNLLETLGLEKETAKDQKKAEGTSTIPVSTETPVFKPVSYYQTKNIEKELYSTTPITPAIATNEADQTLALEKLTTQHYNNATNFYNAKELNKAKEELYKGLVYSPEHSPSKRLLAEIDVAIQDYLKRTNIVCWIAAIAGVIFILFRFDIGSENPYLKFIILGAGYAIYQISRFLFKISA